MTDTPAKEVLTAWDTPTGHWYVSTSCQHFLHDRCRKVCKFCPSHCLCPCHGLAVIPKAKD